MPISVGDVTTDPTAQSFISVADADAYLAPERIEVWDTASVDAREAALVTSSRWLAATYSFKALSDAALVAVGLVAARLGVESLSVPLFAGTDTAQQIHSETVGSISVTYRDGALKADAAGMAWPWLKTMLRDQVEGGSTKWVNRA